MVDGSFLEVLENTRKGFFADEVDTHEVGVRLFDQASLGDIFDAKG